MRSNLLVCALAFALPHTQPQEKPRHDVEAVHEESEVGRQERQTTREGQASQIATTTREEQASYNATHRWIRRLQLWYPSATGLHLSKQNCSSVELHLFQQHFTSTEQRLGAAERHEAVK